MRSYRFPRLCYADIISVNTRISIVISPRVLPSVKTLWYIFIDVALRVFRLFIASNLLLQVYIYRRASHRSRHY